MVKEHLGKYPSLWAGVESITPKFRCVLQISLEWVKLVDVDNGARADLTASEAQQVKDLKRKPRQLAGPTRF
jgi:hypothetical protein